MRKREYRISREKNRIETELGNVFRDDLTKMLTSNSPMMRKLRNENGELDKLSRKIKNASVNIITTTGANRSREDSRFADEDSKISPVSVMEANGSVFVNLNPSSFYSPKMTYKTYKSVYKDLRKREHSIYIKLVREIGKSLKENDMVEKKTKAVENIVVDISTKFSDYVKRHKEYEGITIDDFSSRLIAEKVMFYLDTNDLEKLNKKPPEFSPETSRLLEREFKKYADDKRRLMPKEDKKETEKEEKPEAEEKSEEENTEEKPEQKEEYQEHIEREDPDRFSVDEHRKRLEDGKDKLKKYFMSKKDENGKETNPSNINGVLESDVPFSEKVSVVGEYCSTYAEVVYGEKIKVNVKSGNPAANAQFDPGPPPYIDVYVEKFKDVVKLSATISHELTHAVDAKKNGGELSMDISENGMNSSNKLVRDISRYCYYINPNERNARLGEMASIEFIAKEMTEFDPSLKRQVSQRILGDGTGKVSYQQYHQRTQEKVNDIDAKLSEFRSRMGELTSQSMIDFVNERISYIEMVKQKMNSTEYFKSFDSDQKQVEDTMSKIISGKDLSVRYKTEEEARREMAEKAKQEQEGEMAFSEAVR